MKANARSFSQFFARAGYICFIIWIHLPEKSILVILHLQFDASYNSFANLELPQPISKYLKPSIWRISLLNSPISRSLDTKRTTTDQTFCISHILALDEITPIFNWNSLSIYISIKVQNTIPIGHMHLIRDAIVYILSVQIVYYHSKTHTAYSKHIIPIQHFLY